MRYIIGYGNSLRAEDAFGLDVVQKLESQNFIDTTYLYLAQLTPELVLDLFDASEIIFIDACFSSENNYVLACSIKEDESFGLSHHISYKVIVSMLNDLYNKFPKYQLYSMLTNNFEKIENRSRYKQAIDQVVNYMVSKLNRN